MIAEYSIERGLLLRAWSRRFSSLEAGEWNPKGQILEKTDRFV